MNSLKLLCSYDHGNEKEMAQDALELIAQFVGANLMNVSVKRCESDGSSNDNEH